MSKEEATKTFWTTLVTSTLFVIFGIFLLFQPNTTLTIISRIVTIIATLIGIFGLYKYLTRDNKEKKIDVNIVYSLLAFIMAVVVFVSPNVISGFIPMILGLFMIVNSVFKVGYLKYLKKSKNRDFGVCVFTFTMMVILGILLILNALDNVLDMTEAIGIIITFYSILDVIISYLFRNNVN